VIEALEQAYQFAQVLDEDGITSVFERNRQIEHRVALCLPRGQQRHRELCQEASLVPMTARQGARGSADQAEVGDRNPTQ
jgi:hypothetical protein